MSPEASYFLAKAERCLFEAEKINGIALYEAAGRSAYLAAFHAAQAYLFDHTGRVVKTHNGVRTEFDRLTREDGDIPNDLRGFLAKSYQLKSIADYGIDPVLAVSANHASAAIVAARAFVAMCRRLLDRPAP